MTALCVLLGGAIGAPVRYLGDSYLKHRLGWAFPVGTLAVNLVGCLMLGLVLGAVTGGSLGGTGKALLGTGFCGGLTTFSAFSVETVELWQGRKSLLAVGYLAMSVVLGIAAAAAGYTFTR
ncbi:fluoride efflux transporter CrcB [Jatrophihabitans telluris]|uniref:Fluoride-specific ion channel FluC n=1 Tax=Jatrophihabitans telluris TaxID=2038343 RepID=A0ABY4R0Z5_9ACTN|nr:fluoride efflux transporter CrcB [Jatrophihabitans telluris]UQX88786.1 fluoride efflux transporter CrcB [Jatrophihabitans telluris]